MTPAACEPTHNCFSHYGCGLQGQKLCVDGWTGIDCEIQILNGPADCEVYESMYIFVRHSRSNTNNGEI